ncbi:hypothetical protein DL765_000090 [Monosporascus sp. GIB2]|nr:hypothetical protein DL765_000090 [Monosporascus sp. GIB2]
MVTQYDYTKKNFGNAELIDTLHSPSAQHSGLFLALSMYGFAERTHLYNTLALANVVGKLVSVIYPVTSIALLQLEAVQGSFMGFLVLADLPHIYDRWLLIRFSIGFCILAIFNLTNILCQIAWHSNISRDVEADGPDMSVARARHDSALFLPGVSSSLLAFIIFGTTTPFRKHMRKVFIDRWRDRPTQPPPIPSSPSPQTGYEVRVYGPNGPNTTVHADSGIPPSPLLLRQHLVRDRVHHLGVEDVGGMQLPRERVPPPHDALEARQVLLGDAVAVPRQDLELGPGSTRPPRRWPA